MAKENQPQEVEGYRNAFWEKIKARGYGYPFQVTRSEDLGENESKENLVIGYMDQQDFPIVNISMPIKAWVAQAEVIIKKYKK